MKKVLVIEDDQPLSWLLEKILAKKYKVKRVSNAMEACLWLSEGNHTDLIISDINMPLMDGVELLENFTVSGLYKNIPFIILSGNNDSNTKRKCEKLGALTYFVKPFDPGKLLKEVERQFESKSIYY